MHAEPPNNPQKGIPFEIYERDPTPDARGQGWAITLHWALEYLRQIVPDETLARIQAVQVDPDVARHDNGTFLFINLATGEPRFKIPPSGRWRVSREGMRRALLAGIEDRVHWGKRVVGVDTSSTPPDRVRLVFENGNGNDDNNDGSGRVTGKMVIGVEGSRSIVRRVLRPDAYSNEQLPIRFTGVAVDLTPAEVQPLRSMDPLLFQGCEPESGTFFWFSMLETPLGNGTAGTGAERFRAQVCMSWPVRSEGDEVASTDEGRLANMKRRADRFTPFLRKVVQDIPQGTSVTEITLADWECLDWDNRDGRVTLAGDAAHAMTMCMSASVLLSFYSHTYLSRSW